MNRYESTPGDEARIGLRFLYRAGADRYAPLVVFIHGRAGNRSVMWPFERGVPEHCHIVSFEAFLPDPIGGWSWWDMQTPGSKREAIHYAANKFTNSLAAFIAHYGLEPRARIGLGFSQGSVLLSAVTLLELTPFDGIGILAGFVFLPERKPSIAERLSVFVAHGTKDQTISIERARTGVRTLKSWGVQVEFIEEDVEHKVGIQGTRALKSWIHGLLSEV